MRCLEHSYTPNVRAATSSYWEGRLVLVSVFIRSTRGSTSVSSATLSSSLSFASESSDQSDLALAG